MICWENILTDPYRGSNCTRLTWFVTCFGHFGLTCHSPGNQLYKAYTIWSRNYTVGLFCSKSISNFTHFMWGCCNMTHSLENVLGVLLAFLTCTLILMLWKERDLWDKNVRVKSDIQNETEGFLRQERIVLGCDIFGLKV